MLYICYIYAIYMIYIYIYIYIYIHIYAILTSLSSSSPLAWLGRYHNCGIIRGILVLTS